MSLSPLDVAQYGQVATLVEFTWGAVSARYAQWTDSIVAQGKTYTALPTMSINYGEQHGGAKDEPATIVVPDTIIPVKFMILRKWFPVQVVISECDPTDPDGTQRTTYKGRVALTSAAKGQNGRVVSVKVAGLKAGLAVRLGLVVVDECQWTFGDRICGVDVGPLTEVGFIYAIEGTVLKIGGLSPRLNYFWNRGIVTVDGHSIGIRAWISGESFNLFRLPPKEWVGQPCTVIAGCDKTLSNCRTKWVNEAQFGAIGTKILSYNPQGEVPP